MRWGWPSTKLEWSKRCVLVPLHHVGWTSASGPLGGAVLRGTGALPEASPAPHHHPAACLW